MARPIKPTPAVTRKQAEEMLTPTIGDVEQNMRLAAEELEILRHERTSRVVAEKLKSEIDRDCEHEYYRPGQLWLRRKYVFTIIDSLAVDSEDAMPSSDITLCVNTTCPFARFCRRSTESGTKPDAYQSWAMFYPSDDDCDDKIPVRRDND